MGVTVTLYFDSVPFHHDWREYVCPGVEPFCHTGGSPQAPPEGEQQLVKNTASIRILRVLLE